MKSYLVWVREEVLSWEVENYEKGVDKTGIRNLSLFCEMVGLEEKYVRTQIKKAEGNSIIVSGWKISWMSIDDVRSKFEEAGVVLAPRTGKVSGKVLKDKKDFQPGDYELHKAIERFMK